MNTCSLLSTHSRGQQLNGKSQRLWWQKCNVRIQTRAKISEYRSTSLPEHVYSDAIDTTEYDAKHPQLLPFRHNPGKWYMHDVNQDPLWKHLKSAHPHTLPVLERMHSKLNLQPWNFFHLPFFNVDCLEGKTLQINKDPISQQRPKEPIVRGLLPGPLFDTIAPASSAHSTPTTSSPARKIPAAAQNRAPPTASSQQVTQVAQANPPAVESRRGGVDTMSQDPQRPQNRTVTPRQVSLSTQGATPVPGMGRMSTPVPPDNVQTIQAHARNGRRGAIIVDVFVKRGKAEDVDVVLDLTSVVKGKGKAIAGKRNPNQAGLLSPKKSRGNTAKGKVSLLKKQGTTQRNSDEQTLSKR